jgi:hypothetical protein
VHHGCGSWQVPTAFTGLLLAPSSCRALVAALSRAQLLGAATETGRPAQKLSARSYSVWLCGWLVDASVPPTGSARQTTRALTTRQTGRQTGPKFHHHHVGRARRAPQKGVDHATTQARRHAGTQTRRHADTQTHLVACRLSPAQDEARRSLFAAAQPPAACYCRYRPTRPFPNRSRPTGHGLSWSAGDRVVINASPSQEPRCHGDVRGVPGGRMCDGCVSLGSCEENHGSSKRDQTASIHHCYYIPAPAAPGTKWRAPQAGQSRGIPSLHLSRYGYYLGIEPDQLFPHGHILNKVFVGVARLDYCVLRTDSTANRA